MLQSALHNKSKHKKEKRGNKREVKEKCEKYKFKDMSNMKAEDVKVFVLNSC